jgi:lipopolysaccharide biosynthesis glycosyltransferase
MLHRVIALDLDLVVLGDIAELYGYLDKFADTAIFGLSPELQNTYVTNGMSWRITPQVSCRLRVGFLTFLH